MAKVIMEGVIDCIMHSSTKKITPSSQTLESAIDDFPKEADIEYSKIWIVLDGSDPENPWWLEIERPMIPACEWKERGNLQIRSGKRVRVTLELLEKKERT